MKPCPPWNERVYLVKISVFVIDRIFQRHAPFNFSVSPHVWIHIDLTAGGHSLYKKKKRERERERKKESCAGIEHFIIDSLALWLYLFIFFTFFLYSVLKLFAMTNHRCTAHAPPTLRTHLFQKKPTRCTLLLSIFISTTYVPIIRRTHCFCCSRPDSHLNTVKNTSVAQIQ